MKTLKKLSKIQEVNLPITHMVKNYFISIAFQYLVDLIKKQNNKIDNLADSLSTF